MKTPESHDNQRIQNPLLKALGVICRWLDAEQIPYMVFGGVANSLYGDARQTFDVDIKLHLRAGSSISQFIEDISDVAEVLPENPLSFVSQTQVLPVLIEGVRVDLVFAGLPFEIEAIERSLEKEVFGLMVRVCTPEDLIIQKSISTRAKDWLDIENLIQRKNETLDWNYIEKHCHELSVFLARPELINRLMEFKNG